MFTFAVSMQFMKMRHSILVLIMAALACSPRDERVMKVVPQADDMHTFADTSAVITHLDLDLEVDFKSKQLTGFASYHIRVDSATETIVLDARDLHIDSVLIHDGIETKVTTFSLGESQSYLGSPLSIDILPQTKSVKVFYRTSPDAAALLWLSPEQTHEKIGPFLFTQGQAILTRTWIPIQDSPGIRFTYSATIRTEGDLIALMSADNPTHISSDGIYQFSMDLPIPAYLMALCVGHLEFAAISERTGVYAEPGMLDACQAEMEDMEKMMVAAETDFGSYRWGRYDLLVLPPSFPFGGMENPKLTFATPTIIAGDKSLTSLVAHELAHSWSGNLVTNATWDDFWLNEGHTVYLERRIMEQLYGTPYADMLALLGYQDLQRTINDLGTHSDDTHLELNLTGRDPDDGMTDIAYEKGYLLLRTIEEQVGRQVFDQYLNQYFEEFAFQSLSTEQWEAYINFHLLDTQKVHFDLQSWLYGPGLPESHTEIASTKFDNVDNISRDFVRIGRINKSNTRSWSTHEWLHFIRSIPDDLHVSFYEKLEEMYQFSEVGNSEILAAWLELSIKSGYVRNHNLPQLETFLVNIGRRKFLSPLYAALKDSGELELAKKIFSKARKNYHAVAEQSIATLLSEDSQAL